MYITLANISYDEIESKNIKFYEQVLLTKIKIILTIIRKRKERLFSCTK
jgi:hypothetical protein